MNGSIVISGRVTGQVFVPDGPMPNVEGRAELLVLPSTEGQRGRDELRSIFDFIGKCSEPRTAEDLDAQLREERNGWYEG